MTKKTLLACAILGILANPLAASDDPKTLPPAAYEQMKSGKKLEKVWLDPGFDKAKGFKIGPVVYKAENRNGEVMEYLGKALSTLGNPDSPFTMKVAVVKVTTKTFTGFGSVMGYVMVEGRIVDSDDKVVGTFIAKERAGGFASAKDDYPAACDKIASDIAKDLQ